VSLLLRADYRLVHGLVTAGRVGPLGLGRAVPVSDQEAGGEFEQALDRAAAAAGVELVVLPVAGAARAMRCWPRRSEPVTSRE
jgi:mannose/fructose/N-acetylgalactosamine-specific phosphotransferase system component IIB